MIRPVQPGDAERITDIYNYYILNTSITFEEEKINPKEMEKRTSEYMEYYPWMVYMEENRIIVYAYAARWRPRSAYRHSVEVTVYVDKDHHRKGIILLPILLILFYGFLPRTEVSHFLTPYRYIKTILYTMIVVPPALHRPFPSTTGPTAPRIPA